MIYHPRTVAARCVMLKNEENEKPAERANSAGTCTRPQRQAGRSLSPSWGGVSYPFRPLPGGEAAMLDVPSLRRQFPALHCPRDGRPAVFLDGPGGTQVPQRVIDAMARYLATCNANHGGAFATSRESDRILRAAHAAVADLLNAPSAEEVVFGPNMTTLTFHLSRALARTWRPGDEVIVTRLDHDANVRPWVYAAEAAGATLRWAEFDPATGELSPQAVASVLSDRTRLVALTGASNLIGTRPDLRAVSDLVHAAGGLLYVDGVHLTAHVPIDIGALGADFFGCSPYKFLGPHCGVVGARPDLLEQLHPDKLLPATEVVPERFE